MPRIDQETNGNGRPVLVFVGPLAVSRRKLLTVVVSVLALALVGTLGVVLLKERDVTRPGWNLVWNDEFTTSSLNRAHWNAQDLFSIRNNELEYYRPENVRVRDGHLELTSQRQPFQGHDYTSGAVDTHGKFSFTYGRVEIRARLPQMGQGIWPALWLLGDGCNPVGDPCPWPTAGSSEIDIMEAVNAASTLYNDMHYGNSAGQSLSVGRCARGDLALDQGFHTFAVEWEPSGLVRWYLDQEQVCERMAPGFFDAHMYLFVNTAVGGDWPGAPDAGTPFPQRFTIDHVRVYQRA